MKFDYEAYERERERGRSHEELVPYFPEASAFRKRYADRINTGARSADDIRCDRCGSRTCDCAKRAERDRRADHPFYL